VWEMDEGETAEQENWEILEIYYLHCKVATSNK
jgi:hypothetical protein